MQTKKEFEKWWKNSPMNGVIPTKANLKDFMLRAYDRGAGDYMDYIFETCHVSPRKEKKDGL